MRFIDDEFLLLSRSGRVPRGLQARLRAGPPQDRYGKGAPARTRSWADSAEPPAAPRRDPAAVQYDELAGRSGS
jgi:hypothetical protein